MPVIQYIVHGISVEYDNYADLTVPSIMEWVHRAANGAITTELDSKDSLDRLLKREDVLALLFLEESQPLGAQVKGNK